MIFEFVSHRLRPLARIPFAPQLLDVYLLVYTALFAPDTLAAIEIFESEMLKLRGVSLHPHRFGGTGFFLNNQEFAHIHGNGLLDAHLTRELASKLIEQKRALPHHVLCESDWISLSLTSKADLANAVEIALMAARARSQRGRLAPGGKAVSQDSV